MTKSFDREPFMLDHLHPVMMTATANLMAAMRAHVIEGHVLYPFEGFRHPARQYHLFATTKNTKAGPWESAHQYGMAVDFAGLPVVDGSIAHTRWTWDVSEALWLALKREARTVGLDVPITWDRGHVIHPLITKKFGLK